ncbi:MAG TPA: EI24 domain-containing protein [Candidatus Cybelea sp.]|nr:EI24 domain-containing protein [Candidatus Cybelea sp.]
MFNAFSRAVEQFTDPAFRRVLYQSAGLTLLTYIVTGMGLAYGLKQIPHVDFPYIDSIIDILASFGVALALAYVFPTVASLFVGLFVDDIADAVERRYYPGVPQGKSLPIGPAIYYSLRFFLVIVIVNLVALPFYILLIWFPPLAAVLFYSINGYILGREYFELVAMRHVPPRQARNLRKSIRGQIFVAGVIVSFVLTLPVVNLLVPIIATAAMVHIFQGLDGKVLTVVLKSKE